MNKAKLKSYAPAARRDFIQAVTDRAHFFGLSEAETIPVVESGDFAMIGGNSFPRTVGAQRRKLETRVKRDGFSQVMEAVAYTWFNRFLALRYMELHSYLEHGFRVLSNSGNSNVPEILDHAAQVELSGLNKQRVVELKLDGSKDAELYRMLLVAQCNALHAAMPFLFEKIEDETELLLPDNLLHSDSLIRKLVTEIEEDDWKEVEIIGWLYQFYISEKKDQVIGKVVKVEDIPAATQLFTPNWIVKYMVQNSLGQQWLATYPNSPLKAKMEYYIEPAEQTDEVRSQLAAMTPDSLDPEKLTLLDPASGSGHILVEAYDVFKEIYLERGYSNRDFPRLILEKNLYGLDIDDRAAQMAGFALLMKAREDDRKILRNDNPVKLNVMAITESLGTNIDNYKLSEYAGSVKILNDIFSYGKIYGSLIQIPAQLATELIGIAKMLDETLTNGDLYSSQEAHELLKLVEQAKVMAGKYDCVVANPPYMGSKGMPSVLKEYAKERFPDSKLDLFAMFIERGFNWCKKSGFNSMVTMQSWMFLSSFEDLRSKMLRKRGVYSLVHIGFNSFPELNSKIALACAFVIGAENVKDYLGTYVNLNDAPHSADKSDVFCERNDSIVFKRKKEIFYDIPGSPIAYWISPLALAAFANTKITDISISEGQNITSDNARFIKFWWEVLNGDIGKNDKWLPYAKGGDYRRWYGNLDYVVDWSESARQHYRVDQGCRIIPEYLWYRIGITWTLIAIRQSFRILPVDATFDKTGSSIFIKNDSDLYFVLALLNSTVSAMFLKLLNPTLALQVRDVRNIPLKYPCDRDIVESNSKELADLSLHDWDLYERSQGFKGFCLLIEGIKGESIEASWGRWSVLTKDKIARTKYLEEENNSIFIKAYGLQGELSSEVPEDQITLASADRETDMKRLISYSIGCMMGRYSLDQKGLTYASSRNIGFDHLKYQTFPADEDGIVPVLDIDLFPDDACSRFEEFLKVVWSPETLEENLKFTADSLSPRGGETPRETIRRYISTQFYKDHMQTYKKCPIYWLFSSGKQRAFECLVYLHRYNDATLSRMRNEYVTPLQGKFSAQADYLSNEINAAASTAERNRLQKQLDTLRKKQVELASFDDLLRHYADQRISLDLDEGVKVNYGKFGGLLAEVKAITGGAE
jgi:type II restriction/modification system DNA methylase subunit YeeA